MKLFGDKLSGNCYKIALLASLTGHPLEWVDMDILAGDTRSDDFLRLNPAGKLPTLVLDDDKVLTESNAILHYLAKGSPYLPDDEWLRCQILQWQFWEQYSHEPYIAVARFICKYLGEPEERREELAQKQARGYGALALMEKHLSQHAFFVGEKASIADISLYAYTHVADEGGFELAKYPQIRDWLSRIQAIPGYIGIG